MCVCLYVCPVCVSCVCVCVCERVSPKTNHLSFFSPSPPAQVAKTNQKITNEQLGIQVVERQKQIQVQEQVIREKVGM